MIALLMWLVGMAAVGAQLSGQCNTERQQQRKRCQGWCECDCDEYWDTDFSGSACESVCGATNNDPVGALSWCANYSVADKCDKYGSNWADSTIQSQLDIVYMQAYGREFKLNFFTDTARADEILPLALIIHGGGFNTGTKNNCKIFESAREFASRGYRAIAINYPLCGAYWNGTEFDEDIPPFGSSERGWHAWDADTPLYPLYTGMQHPQCDKGGASSNTHPEQYAQSQEVANRAGRYAIHYAHSQAETWAIDIAQTVCHGASAGAITCYEMFLFNTTVRYKPENTGLPLDPEIDQMKVNVAAGRAGGLIIPEVRAVTQETVDAMAPGAAVWDLHGSDDIVVDISSAEFLMDEMETFNVLAELVIAEGEGHSLFEYQFFENPDRLDDMFEFIETHLGVCENDDDGIIALAASQTPPRVVTGCRQVANSRRNFCNLSQVLDLCCKACAD